MKTAKNGNARPVDEIAGRARGLRSLLCEIVVRFYFEPSMIESSARYSILITFYCAIFMRCELIEESYFFVTAPSPRPVIPILAETMFGDGSFYHRVHVSAKTYNAFVRSRWRIDSRVK